MSEEKQDFVCKIPAVVSGSLNVSALILGTIFVALYFHDDSRDIMWIVSGAFFAVPIFLFSFFISITLGTFLGFLSGTFRAVKYFFSFPLALLRTTPVAALILILVFSFPSSSVPVAAAVLMTLPLVITSICTGANHFQRIPR